MPTFRVAHIREQGENMLLFPLTSAFGRKTPDDQCSLLDELEARAHAAGLAGRAVAVWESSGRTYTIGPKPWQAFLRGLSIRVVLASVNKEISW